MHQERPFELVGLKQNHISLRWVAIRRAADVRHPLVPGTWIQKRLNNPSLQSQSGKCGASECNASRVAGAVVRARSGWKEILPLTVHRTFFEAPAHVVCHKMRHSN